MSLLISDTTLVPPKSGDTIEKTDIIDMFEAIRKTVNNLESKNIKRAALGPQHMKPRWQSMFAPTATASPMMDLGNSLTGFDSIEWSGSSVLISANAADDSDSDITSNWTVLSGLTLNNSRSKYYLPKGTAVVVFFTLRVKDWTHEPDTNWWFAVACTYIINGGSETVARETVGGVRAQNIGQAAVGTSASKAKWNHDFQQEQNLSFWYVIDTSRVTLDADKHFTLDELKIRAARVRSNGAAFTASEDEVTVVAGNHSFFALRS